MPRIPDAVLDCVLYLYKTSDDPKNGVDSGGTGFLVSFPSALYPSHEYFYVVTNWHVAVAKSNTVIRLNTEDGEPDIIETDINDWHFLSRFDDIAIYSGLVLEPDRHKTAHVSVNGFATDDVIASQSLGLGDDVFMIGRFIDHDGGRKNLPAARFGNISIMPTPIKQDDGGHLITCYCIDLHSRSGFSGSPVFVYRTSGTNLDKILQLEEPRLTLVGGFLYLLGVHHGQFREPLTNCKGEVIHGLSGMTMVIPAQKIMDILNSEKLKTERMIGEQQLTEKFLKEGFPPVPESNEPS